MPLTPLTGALVACLLVGLADPSPVTSAGRQPARQDLVAPRPGAWRGVAFNPQVAADPDAQWLLSYPRHRDKVRQALSDIRTTAGMNLVSVFVLIPSTLRVPVQGNRAGEALSRWANLDYLDNVAAFVDDCHDAGVSVELDLVDNRWIPHRVDPEHHIGGPGKPWWPVADDTPWDESATWYCEVIRYIEARAAHPESIAMWCMMGNYALGAAEPVLWDDDGRPEVRRCTEQFVKHVWPRFRAAGRRPKAAPIMLPIFADNAYWRRKSPADRLSAFRNLKKWLVDDLHMTPDYWVMSTYPYCDPAPDGFRYLSAIVAVLGKENTGRILSTDLKGPGHEAELKDTILQGAGPTGEAALRWHVARCARYGFAGWWIWAYQDTPATNTGIRRADGTWKRDLLGALRRSSGPAGSRD